MFSSLVLSAQQMQNVYTPLPLNMHFIFCLAATVVYLLQFYRKKSWHYVLLLAAADLTFVTQLNTSSAVITCLFICEILLLAGAAVMSFIYSKKKKSETEVSDDEE